MHQAQTLPGFPAPNDPLRAAAERATARLAELGYPAPETVDVEGSAGLLSRDGEQPIVYVHLVPAGQPIDAALEELAQLTGSAVENGPADYVWATNGEADYFFSWLTEVAVSELPSRAERAEAAGVVARPAARPAASPGEFRRLQEELDRLHEYIYAARDNVNNANDIIYELCKCIFLKVHLEHHRDERIQAADGMLLAEIFDGDRIRAGGAAAVERVKAAFAEIKEKPDYTLQDETGEHSFRIFDTAEAIRLSKPETLARIADMLNRFHLSEDEQEDDVVGRAFDVMLRGKFESKGGVGIYLTPQAVRDAMVDMAFHDILNEDPGALTRRDPVTGRPSLRVGDPACGSGGFLVTAMRRVRSYVDRLVGLSDEQKHRLLADVFGTGFVGADSSPGMVLMARVNMILHGDPLSRVYRVDNSLTTDVLRPETFDLILANPPFKSGGVTEREQADVLTAFRSDITPDGQNRMRSGALSLGAKPDSRSRWQPVASIDPAILFVDRCLQLLKPGGRLLIVLPDGVLSNSGTRYVREYLMGRKDTETGRFLGGKAVVKAVVSLPTVTFRLAGAGAKTSFIYLQKKRPGDEQGPIYMAVADEVGFDVKANKEVITNRNDLLRIVEGYRGGPSTSLDGATVR